MGTGGRGIRRAPAPVFDLPGRIPAVRPGWHRISRWDGDNLRVPTVAASRHRANDHKKKNYA